MFYIKKCIENTKRSVTIRRLYLNFLLILLFLFRIFIFILFYSFTLFRYLLSFYCLFTISKMSKQCNSAIFSIFLRIYKYFFKWMYVFYLYWFIQNRKTFTRMQTSRKNEVRTKIRSRTNRWCGDLLTTWRVQCICIDTLHNHTNHTDTLSIVTLYVYCCGRQVVYFQCSSVILNT